MDDRRVTITVCPDFQRRRCRRHVQFGDPPARYKLDRYSLARSLQTYGDKKLEALWRCVICCQDYFGLAIAIRQASDRNATVRFPIGSDTVYVRGYGLLRIQDENERVEYCTLRRTSSIALPWLHLPALLIIYPQPMSIFRGHFGSLRQIRTRVAAVGTWVPRIGSPSTVEMTRSLRDVSTTSSKAATSPGSTSSARPRTISVLPSISG